MLVILFFFNTMPFHRCQVVQNDTRQDMKLLLKTEVILLPHNFALIFCTAVSIRAGIIEFPHEPFFVMNLIILIYYTNFFLESSFDCRHTKNPVSIRLREFTLPLQRGRVLLLLQST